MNQDDLITTYAPGLDSARVGHTSAKRESRLNNSKVTLLVTGEADFTALDAVAPEDVLVSSIPSAAEWRGVDGAPHPDLDHLVSQDPKSPTDVLLYLGGFSTDSLVYDEADQLATHLLRIGANSVKHIKSNVDLAPLLASRPEQSRWAFFQALAADAQSKLGRRPATKKQGQQEASAVTIAPTVDVENAQIYIAGAEARHVLLEAAAYILRTYTIWDDRRDPAREELQHFHDLEVVINADGRSKSVTVPRVRDADLARPRTWLNRVPGGTKIPDAPGRDNGHAIANAIRKHDSALVPEVPTLRRTGWAEIDGEIGFLSPAGFATARGRSEKARAEIGKAKSVITVLDTADISKAQEVAAARNTFAMFEELTNPNLWFTLWGPAMHSVAGLGVGCAPAVLGAKGSGKSVAVGGVNVHLSQVYGPDGRPMFTFDASTPNVNRAGVGLDGLWLVVDDSRKRTTVRAREAQDEAIERIVRAAYGGGAARFAVSEKDANGDWGEGTPDLSNPMLAFVGEQMPEAEGDEKESSRERFYPCEIQVEENIFASGDARKYIALAYNENLPQQHLASFIRWVAEGIEVAGGHDQWTAKWEVVREQIADSRKELPVSIRVRNVSTVPDLGMRVWLAYLLELGVVDDDRHLQLTTLVNETVTAVALHHGTVNVKANSAPDWEPMLDLVRGALASNEFYVETGKVDVGALGWEKLPLFSRDNDYQPVLGFLTNGRKGRGVFISIVPATILKVLKRDGRYNTLSEKALLDAFKSIAITDPGKPYKTAVINGVPTKTLSLDWETFVPRTGAEMDGNDLVRETCA